MRAALLVIDVQRAFFSAVPAPVRADEIIARINRLSARARARGVPVIIVQHEEASEVPHGSVGWQLDERLAVLPDDLHVRKTTPDSFHNTGLQRLLLGFDVNNIVLCGYASEFCVDTTARHALALGFSVTIAEDAHTTEDKPHLRADQIIEHHNRTLAGITSFDVGVETKPADAIWAD